MKPQPPTGKTLNLISASLLGSILSTLRLFAGLIRVKAVALAFGAAGIGFLSQATEVWLLAATLGSLMLGAGLVTQLKKTSDPSVRNALIRSTLSFQAIILVAGLVLTYFFAEPLASIIFNDAKKSHWIYLMLISIPLTVWSSGGLEAGLFVTGKYSKYVAISSTATVISTAVVAWGAWNGRFEFVFWGWIVNGALMLIGYVWVLRGEFPVLGLLRFQIDLESIKVLLLQSFWMLLAHLTQGFALVSIRSKVIEDLGVDRLGLIQIPIALTAYAAPFLTNQLWGHFHPTISGAATKQVELQELDHTLTWTLFLNFCFALFAYGFGRELILLVYTEGFLEAHQYFFEYLMGNLFYFSAIVLGIYAIAKAKSYLYFLGMLVYFSTWLIIVYLFLDKWGLYALSRGHLLATLLPTIAGLLWLLKAGGVQSCKYFLGLFAVSLLVFGLQRFAVEDLGFHWIGYTLALLYMAFGAFYFLKAWPRGDHR